MRILCRRKWAPPPVVDEDLSEVGNTLARMRAELEATKPERDAQREDAREARRQATELVERNHFGESIQKAMRRRE